MTSIRKSATVIFVDIVGYTSLMQKDEDKALEMLIQFKQILEQEVEKYNGKIIQYFGDGCLLTFEMYL